MFKYAETAFILTFIKKLKQSRPPYFITSCPSGVLENLPLNLS